MGGWGNAQAMLVTASSLRHRRYRFYRSHTIIQPSLVQQYQKVAWCDLVQGLNALHAEQESSIRTVALNVFHLSPAPAALVTLISWAPTSTAGGKTLQLVIACVTALCMQHVTSELG
jgi:hypothetical protein